MASTRISHPFRDVAHQWRRLPVRHNAIPKSLSTSFARSVTTSASSQASVSTITTSADGHVPVVKPFNQQTVLATIHQFPSLEPLRFESYPANYLNLPTRRDILHRAVVYEGDMTRLGTASTKTRYEVRGSARKIRPQKGSGRARLGDKKSPMLKGGGVAFGPKPRDFSTGLQKKVYDLAWRTALSYRFRKGELVIVDNAMELESPSPRLLEHILKTHERERGKGRSLFVTLEERPLFEQALDEMGRSRQSLTWEEVDVKDLLELSRIVIERDALHNILLSHQEDLTHASIPPWHKSMIQSSPPKSLETVVGWSEFRTLMLASPEEREALRPKAYESVAYGRWTQAEQLTDGPQKLQLTISAYELLAEAKQLRKKALPKLEPIEYECAAKDAQAHEIAPHQPHKAAEINLESKELAVKYFETQHQSALLTAQAAEHASEASRLSGDDERADRKFKHAREARSHVADAEEKLYAAKHEAAEQRAKVLVNRGEVVEAQKVQKEADKWLAKAEKLKEENENQSVEVDEAELRELEKFDEASK